MQLTMLKLVIELPCPIKPATSFAVQETEALLTQSVKLAVVPVIYPIKPPAKASAKTVERTVTTSASSLPGL